MLYDPQKFLVTSECPPEPHMAEMLMLIALRSDTDLSK